MPEYLAPGVFVEEVSFRAKSIEGVGTSVAGIVGPTRTGPLRGTPEAVTSLAEFQRVFGDDDDLTIGGNAVPNHTAIAARAFFDNGGKQLFVARVVGGVNTSAADGGGTSAAVASRADAKDNVRFRARFPGAAGNYVLEVRWRDAENLLRLVPVADDDAEVDDILLLTGEVTGAVFETKPADVKDETRVRIKAVVKCTKANTYKVQGTKFQARATLDPAEGEEDVPLGGVGEITDLPASARLYAGKLLQPPAGRLQGEEIAAELRFADDAAAASMTAFLGTDFDGLRALVGTIDTDDADADDPVYTLEIPKALNPGLAANKSIELTHLAALRESVQVLARRDFDIDVRRRRGSGAEIADDDRGGEVVFSYGGLSQVPGSKGPTGRPTFLGDAMPAAPERKSDALASPVSCAVKGGATAAAVFEALQDLFDDDAFAGDPGEGPRYLIALDGGTDGDPPGADDYHGETDTNLGSTGFVAFEDIEDISIVLVPAAVALNEGGHKAVVYEMQKHINKMRYRVGIVDSREGMTVGEVREWRSEFSDTRMALYFPWIRIAPRRTGDADRIVPPSGFMAGLYARTDVQRGVHKAPANDVVLGALGFEIEVNRFQQELLNPNGVNALRSFPGRGHRVWGARTLTDDPEWKYVNVRRYFLFLERSIDKATQWAVFEPNGENLWANIRTAVEDFLFNEWRNGHMLGSDPKEAFFVRCDRSTMTQNDLDNGRLVCLIGVAPLRPAEFVIFRIGQKTADAK